MSIKALCPNLICRNPRVKVLFGYRKNTYQRQTDRFLIRNTEDDDVIKNGSRPDGVEPRPSATPKYDMYMAGAQMAGAQIKRAQITSKTNRWLHQPFVYYRFSLQLILCTCSFWPQGHSVSPRNSFVVFAKNIIGDICDSLDYDIILAVMDWFQSCLCYMGYRTTDYCFQTWLFL